MALTVEEKKQIIGQFKESDLDTGSSQVQVALLTARITDLQDHFKANKKDNHSRRGLLNMVSQRRKLLDHMRKNDIEKYRKLIQDLGLRK
ncbi:MAG: 30S ribosomal protein S15 [Bdellovibrionales bacterium]